MAHQLMRKESQIYRSRSLVEKRAPLLYLSILGPLARPAQACPQSLLDGLEIQAAPTLGAASTSMPPG
jgi:hypothetical protein